LGLAGDGGLVDPVPGDGAGEHIAGRLVVFDGDVGVVGFSSSGHRGVDAAGVGGGVDEEEGGVDGAARVPWLHPTGAWCQGNAGRSSEEPISARSRMIFAARCAPSVEMGAYSTGWPTVCVITSASDSGDVDDSVIGTPAP